jgi:hypothetical protein
MVLSTPLVADCSWVPGVALLRDAGPNRPSMEPGIRRVGRKPVLLLGVFGLSLSMLCFGLSRTFTSWCGRAHLMRCAIYSVVASPVHSMGIPGS